MRLTISEIACRLSSVGFVAPDEDAAELVAAANGDCAILRAFINRRLGGEPLAWITGHTTFCGIEILVDPGVYAPRWQSEPLVERAIERLSPGGLCIDVCTGSGAIAKVISTRRPDARVVASDIDPRAIACARRNGIETYLGDLFEPLTPVFGGTADVIIGVVPYVPTPALGLLPRDTLVFESTISYDGGDDGTCHLRRAINDAAGILRHGGALLLELGGDESSLVQDDLIRAGFGNVSLFIDEDGDVRGIESTYSATR